MRIFLETDRLVLRQFTGADVDNLCELDSDPDVMRFLTGGKPTLRDAVRDQFLPRILAEYERPTGHGQWAALERSTGEFLGWFALSRPAERGLDEADLGYRLRKSAWGKGYATEGARALIRKAFTELGMRRVFAETMAVNLASRRVMEKSGLRFVRTFHLAFDDPIPGTELGEVEYAVRRADWLSQIGGADLSHGVEQSAERDSGEADPGVAGPIRQP